MTTAEDCRETSVSSSAPLSCFCRSQNLPCHARCSCVCVCVHVCVYVCVRVCVSESACAKESVYVCVRGKMPLDSVQFFGSADPSTFLAMHVAATRVCVCVCVCVCAYVCVRVCMRVCVCECMKKKSERERMCVCNNVYIIAYLLSCLHFFHTHVYTRTYIVFVNKHTFLYIFVNNFLYKFFCTKM